MTTWPFIFFMVPFPYTISTMERLGGSGQTRPHKPLTFIHGSLGQPRHPKPSFYQQGSGPAQPPTTHLYRQSPGQLSLGQPLTSIGQPLTCIGWPKTLISIGRPWPSSGAPGGPRSSRVGRASGGQGWQTNLFSTLTPQRAWARSAPEGAQQAWWGMSEDGFPPGLMLDPQDS